MPPFFTRRAVVPSDSCLAEHCEGSVDVPFPKAPHRALSSFLAATSAKREARKEGCYPAAVNEGQESLPRIFPASGSRARRQKERLMSRR